MKQNNYKPQLPDVMEAIFDAAYLIFDLVAAILFFIYSNGDMLFILYGILTLTLCGGDAFHLVPRIIRAVCGSSDKIKKQLGIGLQISSITMTAFYIILMYIWKFTFPELKMPAIIEAIIWISAVVRIVICMFPQNIKNKIAKTRSKIKYAVSNIASITSFFTQNLVFICVLPMLS